MISREFITFMHKKSISVQDERIRMYMGMPGNPDRDACIRVALNCGLDQDNPVPILTRDQDIDQSCTWAL